MQPGAPTGTVRLSPLPSEWGPPPQGPVPRPAGVLDLERVSLRRPADLVEPGQYAAWQRGAARAGPAAGGRRTFQQVYEMAASPWAQPSQRCGTPALERLERMLQAEAEPTISLLAEGPN